MSIETDIESQQLHQELTEGIMRITKINAAGHYGITVAMWQSLTAALEQASANDEVRAIVIDAAGPGFHNGALMLGELKPSPSMLEEADFREMIRRGKDLGRLIASIPKPVIAIARGGARGGGIELLLRSDFIYTLDDAVFQFPEVQLACVTTWGGTQWAGRLVNFRRAQEMLLLSLPVSGRTAEEIGLVHKSFATTEALDEHVGFILGRLRFCSPDAYAGTKRSLAAIWEASLRESDPVESEEAVRVMGTHRFAQVWPMWGQGKHFDYYDGTFHDVADQSK